MIKKSVKQPPPRGIVLFPSSDSSPDGYASELSQFLLKSYSNPSAFPDGTYQVDADGIYQHIPSASPIQGDVKIVSDNYVKTSLPSILGGNCYWEKTGTNIVLSWHGPFGFEMGENPIIVPSGSLIVKPGYSELFIPLTTLSLRAITYSRFTNKVYCHGVVSALPAVSNKVIGAAWVGGAVVCMVATAFFNREIFYSKNAFSSNPDWISAGVIATPSPSGTFNLRASTVASFSASGLKIVHLIHNVKTSNSDDPVNVADHLLQNSILRVTLSQGPDGDISISSSSLSSAKPAFFETTGSAPSNTVDLAIGFKGDDEVIASSVVDNYSQLISSSFVVTSGPVSGDSNNIITNDDRIEWQITTKIGLLETLVSTFTSTYDRDLQHDRGFDPAPPFILGNSVSVENTVDSFDGFQIIFIDFQSEKNLTTKSQKSYVSTRNWTWTGWEPFTLGAGVVGFLGGTEVDNEGLADENKQYFLGLDEIWSTVNNRKSGQTRSVDNSTGRMVFFPDQNISDSKSSDFQLSAVLIPRLQVDQESIRVVVEDAVLIGQYDFDESVIGSVRKTFLPSGQTILNLFSISGSGEKLVSDPGELGDALFRV